MIEFTKDELYEIERLADVAAANQHDRFMREANLFMVINADKEMDIMKIPICSRFVRNLEELRIAEDLLVSIRKKCEKERGSEINRKNIA